MKNIVAKINQVHPLSDEALNALVQEVKRGAFAGHARLQSLKDASSSS